MKKILNAVILLLSISLIALTLTINALADGGTGGLHITSLKDGDTINLNYDDSITISWTDVGAHHYHVTVKNADGSKPFDRDVTGSKTEIEIASRYFSEGENKIFVGAYAEGCTGVQTMNNGSCWEAIYIHAER